jgi:uncharacterized protein (DUF2141 family)
MTGQTRVWKRLGLILIPLAFLAFPHIATSQSSGKSVEYAQVIRNDMRQCSPGSGPAVRLEITGLRSSAGNLFVRSYRASSRDWLRAKRYLTRVDAAPRTGRLVVCVPLPEPGNYAIAVQHDANGNGEVDFSTDGVAMSNNPKVSSFIGIPIPPSVRTTSFDAGSGVTRMTVAVRYRD